MNYIAVALLFVVIYLLYILRKPNPFYRVLFRKHYSITKLFNQRVNNLIEITFNKPLTSLLFRDALYDCMYSYPETKGISFNNLGQLSLNAERFEHFQFECLDFSRIPAAEFNCTEPFNLPGSYIILPADCKTVPLRYCHANLKCIAIPSRHFVPAQEYLTYFPDGKPIRVNSEFYIRVPEEVISEYRNNPAWNSIVLIDENDEIFHPSFYPYWGLSR